MNDSEIKIIVIVLATVVPLTAITAAGCFLYRRSRQRQRRFLFLKRGITPIDDEEIESWRTDKSLEKTPIIEATSNHGHSHSHSHSLEQQLQQHQRQKSTSVSSVRKPPSVIIYNSPNPHEEISSPRSLHHKRSIDVPSTPLLARAPNSRPGLTDETVQGDDAFVSPLKRQPSRLAKLPPSASRHGRTRSSRSSTVSAISPRDPWHGHYPDSVFGPRSSSEYIPRANRSLDIRRQHHRMHSMISPSRMSFDDEVFMGGLSPRPLIRKSEIGRAIG